MGIFSCLFPVDKVGRAGEAEEEEFEAELELELELEEERMNRVRGGIGGGEFRHDRRVSSVDDVRPLGGSDFRSETLVQREGSNRSNQVLIFSLRELSDATKNFRPDSLLGQGGFGRVYKGRLGDGQVVAVKQLDLNGLQGNREFLVEVLMLSLLHHPKLVNLIGYCVDGDQRLLVYEYMPLGSLEDHLHDLPPDREPLDWTTRMKIAAGAAEGLEYLHDTAHPPVIYRDFKPSNILLDDGYNPKLSDFGLAKLGPVGDKTHVTTRVMGTHGYCAPEYAMTGKLTVQSDIYSFGVVFLELITGRRAIDSTRPPEERDLVVWARPLFKDQRKFPKMADPLLRGRFPKRGLYQALAIAAMCLQEKAKNRPPIREVRTALAYLASQSYDATAATAVQDYQACASTKTAQDNYRSSGSSSSNSPIGVQGLRRRESIKVVQNRGDDRSGSTWRLGSDGLEQQEFQWDGSYRTGRGRIAPNRVDRQQAVAEANAWVQAWRSKEKAGKIW